MYKIMANLTQVTAIIKPMSSNTEILSTDSLPNLFKVAIGHFSVGFLRFCLRYLITGLDVFCEVIYMYDTGFL